MTGGDNVASASAKEGKWGHYATKKDMEEAKTLINHLTGLFRTMKSSCHDAANQVSVTKELKSDLHIERMLKTFEKCKTTMELINEEAAQLLMLAEPPESEVMKQCNTWEATYMTLATNVAEAEMEVGRAKANAPPPPAPPAAPAAGGEVSLCRGSCWLMIQGVRSTPRPRRGNRQVHPAAWRTG